MRELIEEYYRTADVLEKRSKEIYLKMKRERDVLELHKLEKRRQLLDTERYEILRDIREMEENLPEEERYDLREAV